MGSFQVIRGFPAAFQVRCLSRGSKSGSRMCSRQNEWLVEMPCGGNDLEAFGILQRLVWLENSEYGRGMCAGAQREGICRPQKRFWIFFHMQ